jgi:EAL domain-containing protein (putative c-di-GMP-specific phosphodiesterase class I)/DNA-binding response OmpR family regulator
MAGERILIVDDDEDVLLIVQTILDNAGYATLTARNGREGVEKALEDRPAAILLDVMMPELSGWEVCTTLKSAPETRQIPIALLTVKSEIRDLITGMQVGADDYITKPFTRKKLLSTVNRLLDEKRRDATPGFLTTENEDLRFQNLLFDAVTELPTVPVIIDALRDRLLDNREMGVLYIDVEQYSHIEETYGWEVFDGLLRHTARTLKRMVGTVFATEDFIAVNRAGGSDFYVFASLETGDEALTRLQRKARQVEESLRGSLDEAFGTRIHKRIGVFVGHAMLRPNPQMRVERLVYRALRHAIAVATTKEEERQTVLRESFREILRTRGIRTVYQPIFRLDSLDVFGHEALTRGPADTAFESPELLFQFAGENESTWELEKLCLSSSASHYAAEDGHRLFINVEADAIAALAREGPQAVAPLFGRSHPVVLEVTERSAIRDVPVFRSALARLRELGFQIAIDDAGSGYASLQAIAELRPDFIKVANTLITGLRTDSIKRDVVEMLVNLSGRIEAVCVAEGIETPEDLEECRRLGIPYGQGFYLGVPSEKAAGAAAREFTGRIRTVKT